MGRGGGAGQAGFLKGSERPDALRLDASANLNLDGPYPALAHLRVLVFRFWVLVGFWL